MITRIVKMHFRPEATDDFLAVYKAAHPKITAMPGCGGVTLLRDIKKPEIMFTYSKWEAEENLEHYRNSELFIETWRKTKALFQEKAEAWSVVEAEY